MILPLRRVLATAVDQVSSWRRDLYQKGVFQTIQAPVPVISVGNLSMGGTGKTPVTLALAESLLKKGKKVGVISRNYKAQINSMALVDPAQVGGAREFGDEPFLIARNCPQAWVFVGPRKSETALFALEKRPDLDVLLIDDGFQHLRLHRDFNVVLIDATDKSFPNVFPLGRGRESLQALKRADWILLTKSNWAEGSQLNRVRDLLPKEIPITEVHFQQDWPRIEEKSTLGVVAALARSDQFLNQVRQHYPGQVQKSWLYGDHHAFTVREQSEWQDFLNQNPGASILTTEKDFVKIQTSPHHSRFQVVRQTLLFQPDGEKFFEKLWSVAR